MICERTSLDLLVARAKAIGDEHVELGELFGEPVAVQVDDLAEALFTHSAPSISLHLGDDAKVSLKRIDGGVIADLSIVHW